MRTNGGSIKSIHRNIILDLLPAYIAGEASEESRALVEEFAREDPETARLIRTGVLDSDAISPKIATPDELEMKTMKRIRSSIRRQMLFVALATTAILMVPLAAMTLTDEVNWNLFDFVVMGALLLGAGLVFVLFHEEPRLGRRFGEEYAAYCRVVGRWFPKSGIW